MAPESDLGHRLAALPPSGHLAKGSLSLGNVTAESSVMEASLLPGLAPAEGPLTQRAPPAGKAGVRGSRMLLPLYLDGNIDLH